MQENRGGAPLPRVQALNSLLHAVGKAGFPETTLTPLRHGARFLTRVEVSARYPVDMDPPIDLYGEEESSEALGYASSFLTLAVNHLLSKSLDDYLAENSSGTAPDNSAA